MDNPIFTDIVSILNNSQHSIKEGALCASNYRVSDLSLLKRIEELNICENDISDHNINDIIELRLNIFNLQKKKFYYSFDHYFNHTPYTVFCKEREFIYQEDGHILILYHASIIQLYDTIKRIAKHTYKYQDNNFYSVIVRNDQTLFLPLIVTHEYIHTITDQKYKQIAQLLNILNNEDTARSFMAMNEIIILLNKENIEEKERIIYLLDNIEDILRIINSAYQYYLRDKDFNKLKFELDNKAIEFRNKIQSVISDSASKLIAIPTAFVLVGASIDFNTIISPKNIVLVISLFIFTVIINIFLGNTRYTLRQLDQTITEYIASFKNMETDPGKISTSLSTITNDIKTQQRNILILRIILWAVPIATIISLTVLFFCTNQ